ncbi:MAG: TonB-dependent receptor [Sedimentisphaerales bacterium]|nr:TonB-dependent receptor [Sedimentisphaerales bacterium]
MKAVFLNGRIILILMLSCVPLKANEDSSPASPPANDANTNKPVATEELLFMELPQVVTATLKEQSTADAPCAINVVTAEDIRLHGYRSLKDIIIDVPGWIDVSDSNEEIVAVRGIFASTTNKILILINGHRMNDLNLGRWNTDQFIGLDVVERIEFVKGPGSVLYGTGALIGVINIITKSGADVNGWEVKQAASLHRNGEDYQTSVTWGKKGYTLDALFNFTYLDAHGAAIDQPAYLDNPPAGQLSRKGRVYLGRYPDNFSSFASFREDRWRLDLRYEHYARATPRCPNSAFYSWSRELVRPLYQENTFYVNFEYIYPIDDDSRLTINPSLNHYELEELSWITSHGADRLPLYGSRSGQDTQYNQWGLKLLYSRTMNDDLDIMLGFDTLLTDFYDMNAVSGSGGNSFTITAADEGRWHLMGGLAQMIWSPLDRLDVTLSARYDTFEDFADEQLIGRGGLVYHFTDALTGKAIYGQSFLSPQWAHVKRITSGAFNANPSLEPETFGGWDFILEYHRASLYANVSFFHSHVEELISAGQGSYSYQNLGENTYKGVEFDSKYRLSPQLSLEGSYSFVDKAGDTTQTWLVDDEIKNIPKHIGRFGLHFTPVKNLDIAVWGRYYANVKTSDNITSDTTIDDWATLDMNVNYHWKNWEFLFGVTNLWDEDYEVGGTVNRPLPRPGRAFHLAATCKF